MLKRIENKRGPKAANPTDTHVGARVRMRRMMLKLSQEKLAEGLSLTFQQVQKYEKGANRIGASRLQQIATILKVPVSFFFEGAPGQPDASVALPDQLSDLPRTFFTERRNIRLATAFAALDDDALKATIVNMVEQIALDRGVKLQDAA